jgi:hypothetical protein
MAATKKYEDEVKDLNSPGVWVGLPGAGPVDVATKPLFVHKESGDVVMQGLPTPTAVEQATIDRLGFGFRIPAGQPVACSEVKKQI